MPAEVLLGSSQLCSFCGLSGEAVCLDRDLLAARLRCARNGRAECAGDEYAFVQAPSTLHSGCGCRASDPLCSAWRRLRSQGPRPTRVCEPGRQQSLARNPLEQSLKLAAVDPVALHDEAGEGIVYQLGKRAPSDVHNISPG